jgi:hypothetical protein
MEKKIYEFAAVGEITEYGYGSEELAVAYLELLNEERQKNLYQMSICTLPESEIELIAFDLLEALSD